MSSITNDKNFRYVFLTCTLVWSGIRGLVLYSFSGYTGSSFADALICSILIFGFCFLLVNNMQYYLPKTQKLGYVLIISSLLAVINATLQPLLLSLIFRSSNYDLWQHDAMKYIRFVESFLIAACVSFWALLWYTRKDQETLIKHQSETEQLAKDAELYMLRQQLQPHFLFNSLNSISALTGKQPEKARHMIQQLSDFLRSTLRKEEKRWHTLAEELHTIQLYLDIEKVRFGHRLQTEIKTPEVCQSQYLPALLLQPLVENAIKHGLYNTIDEVLIHIKSEAAPNELHITVSNPYQKDEVSVTTGTGFGLSSIQRRLFLLSGRQDLVSTQQDESTFTVKVIIPQIHEYYNH